MAMHHNKTRSRKGLRGFRRMQGMSRTVLISEGLNVDAQIST